MSGERGNGSGRWRSRRSRRGLSGRGCFYSNSELNGRRRRGLVVTSIRTANTGRRLKVLRLMVMHIFTSSSRLVKHQQHRWHLPRKHMELHMELLQIWNARAYVWYVKMRKLILLLSIADILLCAEAAQS